MFNAASIAAMAPPAELGNTLFSLDGVIKEHPCSSAITTSLEPSDCTLILWSVLRLLAQAVQRRSNRQLKVKVQILHPAYFRVGPILRARPTPPVQPTGGSSVARCGSQYLIIRRRYRFLELAVKP